MAYDNDSYVPPEREWLLLTGQTGLVFAPRVMAERQLIPERQTALDSTAVIDLTNQELGHAALRDPWTFFESVLEWPAARVFGAPGGPEIPVSLSVNLPEHRTLLEPTWAIQDRDGGWQLLVRIEGAGVDPDERGALDGWEATPQQRFERLLRDSGVNAGVLITDEEIRLVYAPKGETSGWIVWRPRDLATTAGRPMLGGLKLVLGRHRLFTAPKAESLRTLLEESRKAQETVSTQLARQVLGALYELQRGYVIAEPEAARALAARDPHHLYEGLLTVLMRLVFVLYAEDRDLMPSSADGGARALYEQNYSVRGLLDRLDADAALHPDTMDERVGGWGRLLALFRLIHGGHGDWIAARRGKLFDPDAFPFLEGRAEVGDAPSVMAISDGCLHRILSGLMRLDGEQLSYRTLDVEQIGSVYETVMGFTVQAATGRSLAIKAGKNNRTPVFVDLDALAAKRGEDRIKSLKEDSGRGALTDKQAKAIKAAEGADALAVALSGIVDERGSPGGQTVSRGTPILQPTDERRRTGSHYTPRALTEPIVRHALEPAFQRIGDNATPDEVLDLKVCDPAMGSGAFLVEACRQLGERLERAYQAHGLPDDIPLDEDLALYAKRRVAQVSIYGVDKNPMAVDLARLSMWLLTLAKDHEFAFLDHALKSGDSLVGLTRRQIGAAHWDDSKPGHPILRMIVEQKVKDASAGREAIRVAPEGERVVVQAERARAVDASTEPLRLMGDGVVAAFFGANKARAREAKRIEVEQTLASGDRARWAAVTDQVNDLHALGVKPFHWEVEFPEVFSRNLSGFDSVIGNPPFLGGTSISERMGMSYFQFLVDQYPPAEHHCDLVAYFFRRSFDLLNDFGSLGLIATNSISQGDTREGGLAHILAQGGAINYVRKDITWPGEAAVVVSVVVISKRKIDSIAPNLNGRIVSRISAFLLNGSADSSPSRMNENPYFSLGSKIYGQGFVFDDNDLGATKISEASRIISSDPSCGSIILPYIGGEEINQSPNQSGHRLVIQVSDLEHESDLDRFPLVKEILEAKVKPERLRLGNNPNNIPLKRRWWAYQAHRPELYLRLSKMKRALCVSRVTPHVSFAFVDSAYVFSEAVCVFAMGSMSGFCSLQNRLHEIWAWNFASSMKNDLRYTPSDVFETFPFPENFDTASTLESAGQAYYDHRAALMIANGEGMTKTYNRFHDPDERQAEVVTLRDLHQAMDDAVLTAYGWSDLIPETRAEFEPLFADDEEPTSRAKKKWRLRWPEPVREEVLARLLALNAERAATQGSVPRTAKSENH